MRSAGCGSMVRCCLFTAVVLLAAAAAAAQENLETKAERMKNVYAGSAAAPFTKELSNIEETKDLFRELSKWFQDISEDVKKRRNESDGSECTLRGQSWIEDARIYMEDRQIKPPNKSCATRTEHSKKADRNTAFSLLKRAAKLFEKAGKQVVVNDPSIKTLWRDDHGTTAFAFAGLAYEADDQKCTLDYATAMKVGNVWYLVAAVTSRAVKTVGPNRNHIVEHVHQNLDAPLMMNLSTKMQKGEGGKNPKFGNYTTVYTEGDGAARISRMTDMQFDDNRALTAALQANNLAVDQATDALTGANFSILVLPLLMSFIPVALIADVSDVATFFYVLLTDVFAAVPFVIKGIELVQTGTTKISNAETWLVGEVDGVQVAETWAASCSPQDRFRTFGIIVILVGVSAIVLGILIEHLARKWMSYRRDKGEHPEPFGPALLRMDAYIPVGANYMPHDINYDDDLAPNHAADFPPPPPPAAGPVTARFSTLFSGLLRRRAPHHAAHRSAEGQSAAAGTETQDRTTGGGGVGNMTFSNIVGIMRRRSNGQHPDRGAEYDEA